MGRRRCSEGPGMSCERRALSVVPDLIWNPNPTLCAARRSRVARQRRSRAARCAVLLTTAVWAPDQVWGDGGGGVGRRRGSEGPGMSCERRSLSVVPDLIWNPNPTLCAARRSRVACQRRSRAARCAVLLTTAVWAPDQVWGDGGGGVGRRRGSEGPGMSCERRSLSVVPDLIWNPNPTLCAARRSRVACQRRSRAARCAVLLTTAVWAPDQVWGDGGGGLGRRKGARTMGEEGAGMTEVGAGMTRRGRGVDRLDGGGSGDGC